MKIAIGMIVRDLLSAHPLTDFLDNAEKHGHALDCVIIVYWDRFGCKARAFDQIIGSGPRLKRTPFAFGGAMILHRELFECVPFDPLVTRGEDVDYLINSRMFGFSFFLDNTLSIKHLPQPKSHPQWKRLREDIYRFVYQRAKMAGQRTTGNLVHVSPEDFDPYPGEFLKPDLEEKIYRSSMMLSAQYLAEGDSDAAMEAMRNVYLAKHDAPPVFDAFRAYLETQSQWEKLIHLVRQERYAVRAVLERHNVSAPEIHLDREHRRKLTQEELLTVLAKLPVFSVFTEQERTILHDYCHVKTYYEHETVFTSGDHNEEVCLVLKGKLRLVANREASSGSAPLEIAYLTQGSFLGENCLSQSVFRLSGTAEEFTELLCISKMRLKRLLNEHPAIGVKLLQCFLASLSEKINRSNDLITTTEPLMKSTSFCGSRSCGSSEASQSREKHGGVTVLFSALSVDQAHCAGKEKSHEYPQANRLRRHACRAGHRCCGVAPADGAVLRNRPSGQRQSGERRSCRGVGIPASGISCGRRLFSPQSAPYAGLLPDVR